MSAFVIGFKRFLFNVLLFLGSLPEEYEPENVLRPAREKKGRFRPELRAARFLGKEAYRPARRPTGAEHEPTGRQLPGHWRRQAFGQRSMPEHDGRFLLKGVVQVEVLTIRHLDQGDAENVPFALSVLEAEQPGRKD